MTHPVPTSSSDHRSALTVVLAVSTRIGPGPISDDYHLTCPPVAAGSAALLQLAVNPQLVLAMPSSVHRPDDAWEAIQLESMLEPHVPEFRASMVDLLVIHKNTCLAREKPTMLDTDKMGLRL